MTYVVNSNPIRRCFGVNPSNDDVHFRFQKAGIIAVAFMVGKTTDAYREVIRTIKREVPAMITIPLYMGDFEGAMRRAIRLELPGTRILGCLFHYAQALWKNASKPEYRLVRKIRRPGPELLKLLALTSLPLLPAQTHQASLPALCRRGSSS